MTSTTTRLHKTTADERRRKQRKEPFRNKDVRLRSELLGDQRCWSSIEHGGKYAPKVLRIRRNDVKLGAVTRTKKRQMLCHPGPQQHHSSTTGVSQQRSTVWRTHDTRYSAIPDTRSRHASHTVNRSDGPHRGRYCTPAAAAAHHAAHAIFCEWGQKKGNRL